MACLHNVKSELNIASDRIRDEAITPPLRRHLRQAIAKGVTVQILWGRETDLEENDQGEIREILSTIEVLERDLEETIQISIKNGRIV